MYFHKSISLFFLLLLVTTPATPLWAAPAADSNPAPDQVSTASQRPVAPAPDFYPMPDRSYWFGDVPEPDSDIWGTIRSQDKNNQSLFACGIVRDYLHNRPYSKQPADIVQQARTMPAVISFVDRFGLYDLSSLAAQKACALATTPSIILTIDGVLGLIDAAHYYSKTGRQNYAAAIYDNLSLPTRLAGASKDINAIILYSHAKYLAEQGNQKEAKVVETEYVATGYQTNIPPPYYDRKYWEPCTTDWQPAEKAWTAISKQNYSAAKAIIAVLIDLEKKKTNHEQARISRLIQLAKMYSRHGDKQDAENVLEQLVNFTSEDEMLNTRLYVNAELFLLQIEETEAEHTAWATLQNTAKKIDHLCTDGKAPKPYAILSSEERVVKVMDNLAVIYSINEEPAKALRILETTLAYHPAVQSNDYLAHLTLFETQVGDSASAKKFLARGVPVDATFTAAVSRAIDTCSHAGKMADGEEIANILIAVQTKRLAAMSAAAEPGNMGTTPQQIMSNREYELKYELSNIRIKLGALQNKEGRFAEAEKTLKLTIDTEHMQHYQRSEYIIALGQSLEGQKKLDQAIALYVSCREEYMDHSAVFSKLVNAVARRPNLDQSVRSKVLASLRYAYRATQGKNLSKSIDELIDCAHLQNWDGSDLKMMKELRTLSYMAEGKSDSVIAAGQFLAKHPSVANNPYDFILLAQDELQRGNSARAIEWTLKALTEDQLPALQRHLFSVDDEFGSFHIIELMAAGQTPGAETILKHCVALLSVHPQTWAKNAVIEKCALADFYVRTKRFSEAKSLTDQIVPALMEDSETFFGDSDHGISGIGVAGGYSIPNVPKIVMLLSLCDLYIDAGRPQDAAELAVSAVKLQNKWLGIKTPGLIYTHEKLARAYKALNDKSLEENCLQQIAILKSWNFIGQQIIPDDDSKAYAVLLRDQAKGAEAKCLLTEKKIPNLFPDSYPTNSYDSAISAKVRTYTLADESHAIAVLKASIERNGEGNPESVEALSNLALLYWHAQRYDDAQNLLQHKLQIIQDIEGSGGFGKAYCLAELACVEISKNEPNKAKQLLDGAVQSSTYPGARDPLPEVLAAFAVVKFKLGEKEAAVALACKAVEKRDSTGSGPIAPDAFAPCSKILTDKKLAYKANEIARLGRGRPARGDWSPVYPGFFEIN
jgi:tetratricopeptide (TPR) repeat protein